MFFFVASFFVKYNSIPTIANNKKIIDKIEPSNPKVPPLKILLSIILNSIRE